MLPTIPRRFVAATALAVGVGVGSIAPIASAHTPLCACYDNGDGTVLCEGGFSDGSSAAGVRIAVRDSNGNVLIEGSMDGRSEFIFDQPRDGFSVMFDAGAGHQVEIRDRDIY